MSKTLEQVVLALPCDGATTLAVVGALKEAGILDATVYGLCETCGGSRKCQTCEGDGFLHTVQSINNTPGADTARQVCPKCNGSGVCPDCTTVSVVTKEAWEAFVCRYAQLHDTTKEAAESGWAESYGDGIDEPIEYAPAFEEMWAEWEESCHELLSTVLGKTLVAKEVWCLSAGGEVWPTCKESRWLERGDTIAILEDDDE